MKKTLAAIGMLAFLAAPAMAGQCPALMQKIDQAMTTAQVDDATKTKVMELYDKGKAEHEAGNHDASVASLNEALALLGM